MSNHLMTPKILSNDHLAGFQSFFSVFTQILPFESTFGWNILVRKYPFGGDFGNSESNLSTHLNTPPSYGVSTIEVKFSLAHSFQQN